MYILKNYKRHPYLVFLVIIPSPIKFNTVSCQLLFYGKGQSCRAHATVMVTKIIVAAALLYGCHISENLMAFFLVNYNAALLFHQKLTLFLSLSASRTNCVFK